MIFDAHFHIINPNFPLIANKGYLPDAFTVEDYQQQTIDLPISGGAIVSGSFQGTDQSYLLDALKKLGPSYVGVTQLKADSSDSEIVELNKSGIRAVRFNLFRGGSESSDKLESFAKRVNELVDWHVELYIDSTTLPDLLPTLNKLPSYSIDHLGLSKAGLADLYQAVESGAKVKATGFMRCDFDVLPVLKQINTINPEALLFGTDLPGTRAPRPFSPQDLTLIADNFAPETVENILWKNAASFYKIGL